MHSQLEDKLQVLILDDSASDFYSKLSKENNWEYYTHPHLFKEQIAFSLDVAGAPHGILIQDKILVNSDFNLSRDKEALKLD